MNELYCLESGSCQSSGSSTLPVLQFALSQKAFFGLEVETAFCRYGFTLTFLRDSSELKVFFSGLWFLKSTIVDQNFIYVDSAICP